jgi:hypothetical protein
MCVIREEVIFIVCVLLYVMIYGVLVVNTTMENKSIYSCLHSFYLITAAYLGPSSGSFIKHAALMKLIQCKQLHWFIFVVGKSSSHS